MADGEHLALQKHHIESWRAGGQALISANGERRISKGAGKGVKKMFWRKCQPQPKESGGRRHDWNRALMVSYISLKSPEMVTISAICVVSSRRRRGGRRLKVENMVSSLSSIS